MDDDACALGRTGGAAGQGCTCDSQPAGLGTTAGNYNITKLCTPYPTITGPIQIRLEAMGFSFTN